MICQIRGRFGGASVSPLPAPACVLFNRDSAKPEDRQTRAGLRSMSANSERTSVDPRESKLDRFCVFHRLAPAAAALRVHASSKIARTRADFEQFSPMSGNLETEVWREWDSNPRATFAAAGFQDRAPAYRPVLASACVRRGRFQSPRSTSPAIPANGPRRPQARTDDAWGADCRSGSASRPSHQAIS